MRRALTVHIALFALGLAALLAMGASGCSGKEKSAPPQQPPVVKKVVPKEVAKAAEPSPAAGAAAKPPAEEMYNPKGKRDPFEPFLKTDRKMSKEDLAAIPPLQRYDINELRFVGVMWTAKGARALVEDIEGKGYTVTVGTKMGRAGGVVTRITDGQIFVGEEYRESSGARVVREISLKLQTAGGQ